MTEFERPGDGSDERPTIERTSGEGSLSARGMGRSRNSGTEREQLPGIAMFQVSSWWVRPGAWTGWMFEDRDIGMGKNGFLEETVGLC